MKDVKWATFVFWNLLNPVFHAHHKFVRKKVIVDRFLEKQGIMANLGIGVLFGTTAYFCVVPFLPGSGPPAGTTLESNGAAILKALNLENSKEFPVFTLIRAKAEIMTQIYAVMDRVDVRKQKEEVERLKRELTMLKGPSAPKSVPQ